MYTVEGYFEGGKRQWKNSWQISILVALIGILLMLTQPPFFGSIIVAYGLLKFSENYFSGIGSMGIATNKKPTIFYS